MTAVDRLLNLLADGLDRVSKEERQRRLRQGAQLVKWHVVRSGWDAEIDTFARGLVDEQGGENDNHA